MTRTRAGRTPGWGTRQAQRGWPRDGDEADAEDEKFKDRVGSSDCVGSSVSLEDEDVLVGVAESAYVFSLVEIVR